ncbi:hypothetical protein [Desertivirga xinjiangensis]|uniref:hypothetical protein n=1 Tax=Desertivirga xinjiangensis TaxID=539206 RepID=UPI0021094776|nr:hypothetical protein [Pedobacter xinjiangensis]
MQTYRKTFKALAGLFLWLSVAFSCKQPTRENSAENAVDTQSIESAGPYFSRDNHNNPVLCWTAKSGSDSLNRLQYAVYDSAAGRFLAPVVIPASAGCAASAESMGKVAFKNDGTVLAVYSKRFVNEKNPYAGAIYYSLSADNGKTWSPSSFLHSDTSHAHGRGFFDISRLKGGEIAAIWLDGRYGKAEKGSALFLSKTSAGTGFGADSCLNKSTCECCRTDLFCDKNGVIHIAYRSITFPEKLLGKQVRDIVYISSDNNGQTFSAEQALSNDHWQIEGCPHSGPTLATGRNGIHAVWFTAAEGKPGIYHTRALNEGFSNRSLISSEGRHPQMVTLPEGRQALVFEEPVEGHEKAEGPKHQHKGDHSRMPHTQMPGVKSRISLKILQDAEEEKSIDVTDGSHNDHHAVISVLNNKLIVAWVRELNNKPAVYYRAVHLK